MVVLPFLDAVDDGDEVPVNLFSGVWSWDGSWILEGVMIRCCGVWRGE